MHMHMHMLRKQTIVAVAWGLSTVLTVLLVVLGWVWIRRRSDPSVRTASVHARVQERLPSIQWMPNAAAPYRVAVLPDFLSDEDCDALVAVAKGKGMQPSTVYSSTNDVIDTQHRKSETTWVHDKEHGAAKNLSLRIHATTGLPVSFMEALQLVHYGEKGFFNPHFDCCEAEKDDCSRLNKDAGHRKYTLLIYLNDDMDGGETIFPNLKDATGAPVRVRPKKGTAILFVSVADDHTTVLPEAFHGGLPVTRGEKWVANKWVHVREYVT